MRSERLLRAVEFVIWVLAATACIVGASVGFGFLVWNDYVAVKYLLFVVGFLIFGIGSLLIQPNIGAGGPPGDAGLDPIRDGGRGLGSSDGTMVRLRRQAEAAAAGEHRFESRLQEIGPLSDTHLAFEKRVSRKVKLLTTGIAVLAVSFLMELAGIQA